MEPQIVALVFHYYCAMLNTCHFDVSCICLTYSCRTMPINSLSSSAFRLLSSTVCYVA